MLIAFGAVGLFNMAMTMMSKGVNYKANIVTPTDYFLALWIIWFIIGIICVLSSDMRGRNEVDESR